MNTAFHEAQIKFKGMEFQSQYSCDITMYELKNGLPLPLALFTIK